MASRGQFATQLSARLAELQRLVEIEVNRCNENISSLSSQNHELKDQLDQLKRENEALKHGRPSQQERSKTPPPSPRGVVRNKSSPIQSPLYKSADAEVYTARGRTENKKEARGTSRSKTPPPANRNVTREPSGQSKQHRIVVKPVQNFIGPEEIQLLVSRLSAAAYTHEGCKVDDHFWKRLCKDKNGLMSMDEWIRVIRKELRINSKELPDEAAKQIFRELDVDNSCTLNVEEVHMLYEVVTSAKHHADQAISQVAQSSDVSPSLMHTIVSRMRLLAVTDDGVKLNEVFFNRLDTERTGRIGRQAWRHIVRKEFKMSPFDISDEMIDKLFDKIDGDGTGFIEIWDLMALARAADPVEEKLKLRKYIEPEKTAHALGVPSAELCRAFRVFVERLKEMTISVDGYDIDTAFFSRLDANRTGKLGGGEWHSSMRNCFKFTTAELSDQELDMVFRCIDTDQSGFIDIEELRALVKDVHEVENTTLQYLILETRKVHNVCRLLNRCKQLTYTHGGEHYKTELQTGTRVRVCNMRARADLNGMEGTIISFDADEWRYKVCLDNGARMAFAPRNLKSTEPKIMDAGIDELESSLSYTVEEEPKTPGQRLLRTICAYIDARREKVTDLVRRFDKNFDYNLDRKEMKEGLEKELLPKRVITDEELDDMWRIMDKDRSGSVEVFEIERAITMEMGRRMLACEYSRSQNMEGRSVSKRSAIPG